MPKNDRLKTNPSYPQILFSILRGNRKANQIRKDVQKSKQNIAAMLNFLCDKKILWKENRQYFISANALIEYCLGNILPKSKDRKIIRESKSLSRLLILWLSHLAHKGAPKIPFFDLMKSFCVGIGWERSKRISFIEGLYKLPTPIQKAAVQKQRQKRENILSNISYQDWQGYDAFKDLCQYHFMVSSLPGIAQAAAKILQYSEEGKIDFDTLGF